ncbi:MAG: hypothetical protein KBA52_00305 [Candidatus Kapabacteria bacterium]|nr:hypothetical protein [Candidatus Kapabacteria bacterium]
MIYEEFASNISFFEFDQNEFYSPSFNIDEYQYEIQSLKKQVSIEYLTNLLATYPKTFDIFEQLFQMKRFTNTQYIHFCFDVNTLNNSQEELIIQYAKNCIFNFENGNNNVLFNKIYNEYYCDNHTIPTLFILKRSILKYVEKCIKEPEIFHTHIINSINTRLRISNYLFNNLKADELLSAIELEKFLKLKRIPKDIKSIHGNFGTTKVRKKLEALGLCNISHLKINSVLKVDETAYIPKSKSELAFVSEKYIEPIKIRKTNKLKKFDFIILKDGIPRILIETNFYSTSGTKININLDEYIDLYEDISRSNTILKYPLMFSWITDGNFWLTSTGEKLYNNIKQNFLKNEMEILNYNLLNGNFIKELLNL